MTEAEKLAELLLRWEELRQDGHSPTPEDLCADSPQLVDELRQQIQTVRHMEAVLQVRTVGEDLTQDSSDRPPSEPPLAHVKMPNYDVLDVLGRGGMGVVYRAVQCDLDREVALKVLDPALAGTRQLERFQDEARAVADLNHPHIIQIYDIGQTEGVPFFSMELIEGGNLKQRILNGPFEAEQAARLTESIARAVHSVHLTGYVHRDLKPANILLTPEGQPKVTDFGLVKRLDEESGHTQTGEVLGTIGYMAPEQLDVSLAEIGPRTDVYALGTILYEMVTGRPAVETTPAAALKQVLQDDVPRPTRIRRDVPLDVEAICLKCLEKKDTDRYGSAEELADDLRRFLEHRPISARPISRMRRVGKWLRRRPQLATIVFLLGLLLAAWPVSAVLREHREKTRRQARAAEVSPQAREILQRNCFSCHGGDADNLRRQLNVLDHAGLLDSDRRIVVPGKPADSRLIQRIADGSMPPEAMETRLPRLSGAELTILRDWILGGAPAFPEVDPRNPTPPVVEHSVVAAEAKAVFLDRCYECHKYDVAEGGIKILHHRLLLEVRKVIVPGNPEQSELFQLIISDDKTAVMPPEPAQPLSNAQVETIRRWIAAGAPPFPKTEE